MTIDTAIGDPRDNPESAIDDESREQKAARDDESADGGESENGESVMNDDAGHDITREEIEQGNDRATSADQLNRAGTTNKIKDDSIDLGRS